MVSKNRKCCICAGEFTVKYASYKTRTCSSLCKKELVRINTIKQFQDPEKRKRHQKATKKAMSNLDMKYIVNEKRRSYKGKNHPLYGVERSEEWRNKIGAANKGRFKGKTWEEIIGETRAKERRIENAKYMSDINARLMNDRTSKLEKRAANYLDGFEQNKRISKYVVDFVSNDGIVVEIYGDYWHCNPNMFDADFHNRSIDMTAQEKWDYDKRRQSDIEKLGYYVICFWEYDLNQKGFDAIKSAIADFRAKRAAKRELNEEKHDKTA